MIVIGIIGVTWKNDLWLWREFSNGLFIGDIT